MASLRRNAGLDHVDTSATQHAFGDVSQQGRTDILHGVQRVQDRADALHGGQRAEDRADASHGVQRVQDRADELHGVQRVQDRAEALHGEQPVQDRAGALHGEQLLQDRASALHGERRLQDRAQFAWEHGLHHLHVVSTGVRGNEYHHGRAEHVSEQALGDLCQHGHLENEERGRTKRDGAPLQDCEVVEDGDLKSVPIQLPSLPSPEGREASLEAGDWLIQLEPLIGDLSKNAAAWWRRVMQATTNTYAQWLHADPLARLKVQPPENSTLSAGFERLDQRDSASYKLALAIGAQSHQG